MSKVFFFLLDRLFPSGWMMWLRTFIWELVHKKKDAGAALETKSQPEQKLFYLQHQKGGSTVDGISVFSVLSVGQ